MTCRDEAVINNQVACENERECEWNRRVGECEVRSNVFKAEAVTSFA